MKALGAERGATRRGLGQENAHATYLCGLDRYEQALGLYMKLSLQYRDLYGAEHLKTLDTADAIARTLHALGRSREAQPLAEITLDRTRRHLGDNHPKTRQYTKTLESVNDADAG
jgi:hypothetical protein